MTSQNCPIVVSGIHAAGTSPRLNGLSLRKMESMAMPSSSGGSKSSIRATRLVSVPTVKEKAFSRPYSANSRRMALSVPSR